MYCFSTTLANLDYKYISSSKFWVIANLVLISIKFDTGLVPTLVLDTVPIWLYWLVLKFVPNLVLGLYQFDTGFVPIWYWVTTNLVLGYYQFGTRISTNLFLG